MNPPYLELRRVSRPLGEPVAWVIPGQEPVRWLRELESWQTSLGNLRLHVLPTSFQDRTPAGVLVAGPSDMRPPAGSRALPYRRRGNRLYLPCHAELHPPVADDELESILLSGVHVFHPGSGLITFQDQDVLRVHDLLDVPPPSRGDWSMARPGLTASKRLVAVEADLIPDASRMLEEGGEDIGKRSLSDAEPMKKRGISRWMDLVRGRSGKRKPRKRESKPRKPARARTAPEAEGHSSRVGSALLAGGWLGAAGGSALIWLGGKGLSIAHGFLSSVLPAPRWITDRRHLALDRLLSLFDTDPDEALRYAPSLRENRGRGGGSPATDLTRQDVEFSVCALAGDGSRDIWSINEERYRRLVSAYHAAANREMRQGRYRRAAYIFAHLLDDLDAAASALRQGRHYRDAAALYRDFLGRPLEAARCLEKAGLLLEAAEIFESEKHFEAAGILFERIGQEDRARGAYLEAVRLEQRKGDTIAAARILETRLRDIDRARELLLGAWPHSRQAGECLQQGFRLLGSSGHHAAAGKLVGRLREQPLPASRRQELAEILEKVSRTYPDRRVSAQAADATRVLVGRMLPPADPDETKRLTETLARLVPEDRLLQRDTRRFRESKRPKPAARPPVVRRETLKPRRTFSLPAGVKWESAAVHGHFFAAVGRTNRTIVAVEGTRLGVISAVQWENEIWRYARDRLRICWTPERWAVAVVPSGLPIPERLFESDTEAPMRRSVGTPHWLPEGVLAMAAGEDCSLWLLVGVKKEFELRSYDGKGLPRYRVRIEAALGLDQVQSAGTRPDHPVESHEPLSRFPTPTLAAFEKDVFIGLQHVWLYRIHRGRQSPPLAFDWPIFGVVRTPRHIPRRIAVSLGLGLAVVWLDPDSEPAFWFRDMAAPHLTFLDNGRLVAVTKRVCRVLDTQDRRVSLREEFDYPFPGDPPLAVTTGRGSGGLTIFSRSGRVAVYCDG